MWGRRIKERGCSPFSEVETGAGGQFSPGNRAMSCFKILKGDSSKALVGNIPHSSIYIPPDTRSAFVLGPDELGEEAALMADLYTDELFSCVHELGGTAVVNTVSRLVLDTERFENDNEEVMSEKGLGVIYTKTADGRVLRKLPGAHERDLLLGKFYRPYHSALEREVEAALNSLGSCLIIDCHSFSSIPLPYEFCRDADRPDICLGTDEVHTPVGLVQAALDYFKARGFSTALNHPFAGTYVPLKFYRRDFRVKSIMIEVNKRLYMNEKTLEKKPEFYEIKASLKGLMEIISRYKGCTWAGMAFMTIAVFG